MGHERDLLTDDAWAQLAPLLPPQKPRTGRPAKPHRTVVEGIPWALRTGAPWRDLPERFGPWHTVASRFYRWVAAGVWDRLLAALQRRAGLAFHRALVRAARDRWLLSARENLAPVVAATLALGANPSSRAPQAIAAGHRDVLQFLLEGDGLSAEATLRRRLRGAVDHLLTRFQAPDP